METGFVIRVGDSDDYHVEDDIDGVVERLRMNRVTGPVSAWVFTGVGGDVASLGKVGGIEADGYRRNNYIALFWGTHDEKAGCGIIRPITPEEIAEINRWLAS